MCKVPSLGTEWTHAGLTDLSLLGAPLEGENNQCFVCLFVCRLVFLGPHMQHMEVPRLGVASELHLLASTTATATQDPSRVCDLDHSSRQHWILNPLSKARD